MITIIEIKKKIEEALKNSKKRKFIQSIDLSIGFKGIDLKQTKNQIDEVIILPHNRGKVVKICGLVDKELQSEANKYFDKVIMKDDFPTYNGKKKELKKLAVEYDFFVAQMTVMGLIAKVFGRVFGPKGKMPNPKASCVVPPNAKLHVLKDRLNKLVLLKAKKSPVVNVKVGAENGNLDEISENIHYVLTQLSSHLPNGEQNIKHAYVKTTMGQSIKVM